MPECTLLKGDDAVDKLRQLESEKLCQSFFQTHSWLRFWGRRPGFDASVLIVREHDETLGYFPMCIRRHRGFSECFSMPMGTYGGVVALSGTREVLWEAIDKWIQSESFSRVNITEFAQQPVESLARFDIAQHGTQILDLEKYGAPGNLSENHRRNIRKSLKYDFEIVAVDDETMVRTYVELVRESAERHHTAATYDLDFYLVLRNVIQSSTFVWRLVLLDGTPCAGHIYFAHNDGAIYWDGCASTAGLQNSANYFLFDSSIREFREIGYRTLDFGSSPAGASELVRFKKGWGTENVTYIEYDMQSVAYRNAQRLKGWFKR